MTPLKKPDQSVRWLAWAAMLGYVVLSVVFYRERTSYLDGPHFLIEMINNQGFYTPVTRLCSYVTQILPVIGIRAGLEIPTIQLLYSLNISLFYFGVFMVLDLIYRDHKLAFVLAVFLWVITYDSFYMPVSELPLGISFLLLLIAHFNRKIHLPNGIHYLISFILVLHIIFSHPLLLFPLFFCVLFSSLPMILIDRKSEFLLWTGVAILLLVVRIAFFGNGEMEKVGRMQNFMENYRTLFLNQPVNHYLKEYLRTTYLPGSLLSGLTVVLLVVKKQYRHAALFAGMSVLFVLVYVVSHPEYNVRPFIEIYFLVIAFFMAFYLGTLVSDMKLGFLIPVIAVVITVQAMRLIRHGNYFSERTQVYSGILEEMKNEQLTKAVIPLYNAPMRNIGYPFGAGYESLLLSIMEDPSHPMTFTFVSADQVPEGYTTGTNQTFIVNEWYELDMTVFEDRFRLDTTEDYTAFDPTYH